MNESTALGWVLSVSIFTCALVLGWVERAKERAGLASTDREAVVRRDATASGLFPRYGEADDQ